MREFEQLATFHRALAEFCRLDMPLGKALREVARDVAAGPLRTEAEAMAAEVEAGASLADAWRKRETIFPSVYAALIEAGTASGDLPGTLEEIARHAALRAVARKRIVQALAYPVGLIVLLSILAAFLLNTIVPQFAVIFSQITDRNGNPMELPAITRMVIALSGNGLMILPVLGILAVAWAFVRRPLAGVTLPFGLGYRLPIVGPLRVRAALLTFTSVLGGLVRRGLPGDRAIDLAADVAAVPALAQGARSAAERVRGGEGLAAALREEGILSPSFAWLVGAGERRGDLAGGIDEVARVMEERVEGGFATFMWMLAPALSLATGVFVFVVVLAVFYPILILQSALM